MQINKYLEDKIYHQIGEEMGRKEFQPGPIARAVAEAKGDKSIAESLYIKFRFEELSREIERKIVNEQSKHEQELEKRKKEIGYVSCPHCGFFGKPKPKSRGSILLFLIFLCVYIIPGLIIYMIAFSGYKGVCPECGKTLQLKIKKSNN